MRVLQDLLEYELGFKLRPVNVIFVAANLAVLVIVYERQRGVSNQ
jgi:uncharacterized membrane-anchored protein